MVDSVEEVVPSIVLVVVVRERSAGVVPVKAAIIFLKIFLLKLLPTLELTDEEGESLADGLQRLLQAGDQVGERGLLCEAAGDGGGGDLVTDLSDGAVGQGDVDQADH